MEGHCLYSPFYLNNPVLAVDINQLGHKVSRLAIFHLAVGKDKDDISFLCQSGRGTVEANLAAFPDALNGIGGEAGAIIKVKYLHMLVGQYVSLGH